MKKALLIGGGLAVVGGLAYLYLKNKKKEEAILTGGTSATQPSATTPNGTTSGVSDGGIAPLPKGSTITPTTIDGVTTSVITTPNSALTVKTQMELDAILDNIKILTDRQRIARMSDFAKALNSGGTYVAKPIVESEKIKQLKNDLFRLGYEVKEGSGGLFLVKI
jgi:hypothetical protein